MTAKTNRRWMQSALASAAKNQIRMPWERGERRAEMIARRESAAPKPYAPRALAAH